MATSDDGGEPGIRVRSRRRIGTNSLFDVYFDDIDDGRGHRVPDFLAVEPRVVDDAGITGISILPVRSGAIGLMRMYRHPYGGHGWEIPMGFIDRGESPERAAVRELEEETGLTADESSLVSLGGISPAPSVVRARIRLFAGTALGEASRSPAEEAGHGRFAWVPLDEAVSMAERGEIMEPCTLVSLYRYLRLPGAARPRGAG